jgi:hypothetical protein
MACIISSILESNDRLPVWKCARSYLPPSRDTRYYRIRKRRASEVHSCRKARRGSIFVARRAGM